MRSLLLILKFVSIIAVVISIVVLNSVEVTFASRVTMTILYDNYSSKRGLIPNNGFSCIIKGTEKTILFDVGGDGKLLLYNMKKLNVSPNIVDVVVISHEHRDHTGGLSSFLSINNDVTIYFPGILPDDISKQTFAYKAKINLVRQPFKICKGISSTGVMGDSITEQALIINSKKGLILIKDAHTLALSTS